MDSVDELRRAAAALRSLAGAATEGGEFWTPAGIASWACDGGWITESDQRDATYIAALRPEVGRALAEWLEVTTQCEALAVARLINNGA